MLHWTLLAGAASALVAPVVPRPRSVRAAAAVPEKEDVELADCPVAAPYAERLQTLIPTTKGRSEVNASSS